MVTSELDRRFVDVLVFDADQSRRRKLWTSSNGDPTPEEIRAICKQLQAGEVEGFPAWSETIRKQRDMVTDWNANQWTPPTPSTGLFEGEDPFIKQSQLAGGLPNEGTWAHQGKLLEGEYSRASKLSVKQVKELLMSGRDASELVDYYPVSITAIEVILKGHSWRKLRERLRRSGKLNLSAKYRKS